MNKQNEEKTIEELLEELVFELLRKQYFKELKDSIYNSRVGDSSRLLGRPLMLLGGHRPPF